MRISMSLLKDPRVVWTKLDQIVERVVSQNATTVSEVETAQILAAYLSYRAEESYVFRLKDEVREMKRLFFVTAILAAATLVLALEALLHI